MEPTNRQQFEGPAKIKFKISLLSSEADYKIIISEVESFTHTTLFETKSLGMALEMHRNYVERVMKTGMYRILGVLSGPGMGRSTVFEATGLPVWSFIG